MKRVVIVAICCLLTLTEQENNKLYKSQKKRFSRLDRNEVTAIDGSVYIPKLSKFIKKNNLNDANKHHRVKRNLIRRFISRFKGTMPTESEEANIYRTAGAWSFPPAYGAVPNAAFSAGLDTYGEPVYIGRGKIPGEKSVVPGRLQPNDVCVEVAWGGWGRCIGKYEVLTGGKYTWMPGHRDWFPYSYVIAGSQITLEQGQSRLFICRYYIRDENFTDQLVIGKVTKDGRCWIGYNGHEIAYHGVYEILCVA